MITPPKYVISILETLRAAGFEAYLVGGCVRDAVLSRRPNDWDVCSCAPPETIASLFPRTVPTGIKHGTVTVISEKRAVEVTAFRTEGGYSDRRHPDYVNYTSDLTEDLARRDFTMNAMAMDLDGVITDPFGGREDISRKLIRCVGSPRARFEEDALRMLRAVRFASQLGFALEPATLAAISECSGNARELSPERVREELCKLIFSPRPQYFCDMLDLGLLDAFLTPEHPKSSLELRLLTSRLAGLPHRSRLGALCAALERDGYIMSTQPFLSSLRFDGNTIRVSAGAAAVLQSGSRDWKRLLRDYGNKAVLTAHPKSSSLRRVIASGECRSLDALAVTGNDMLALGLSGREVGKALALLLDHVIDHPEDNEKEILCKLVKGDSLWTGTN